MLGKQVKIYMKNREGKWVFYKKVKPEWATPEELSKLTKFTGYEFKV